MKEMYVISGIETKTGNTVFYAIDLSSGGYPYWACGITSAKIYTEVPDYVTEVVGCNFMNREVEEVYVQMIKLETVQTVQIKSIEEVRKAREKEEILKQMNELKKKLEELG